MIDHDQDSLATRQSNKTVTKITRLKTLVVYSCRPSLHIM